MMNELEQKQQREREWASAQWSLIEACPKHEYKLHLIAQGQEMDDIYGCVHCPSKKYGDDPEVKENLYRPAPKSIEEASDSDLGQRVANSIVSRMNSGDPNCPTWDDIAKDVEETRGEVVTLKPLVMTSANPDDPKALQTAEWKAVGIVQEIVVQEDGHIVVLGIPPDEEDTSEGYHNCDQMGCGQSHVLWRADAPSTHTERLEAALREYAASCNWLGREFICDGEPEEIAVTALSGAPESAREQRADEQRVFVVVDARVNAECLTPGAKALAVFSDRPTAQLFIRTWPDNSDRSYLCIRERYLSSYDIAAVLASADEAPE